MVVASSKELRGMNILKRQLVRGKDLQDLRMNWMRGERNQPFCLGQHGGK